MATHGRHILLATLKAARERKLKGLAGLLVSGAAWLVTGCASMPMDPSARNYRGELLPAYCYEWTYSGKVKTLGCETRPPGPPRVEVQQTPPK